MCDVIHAMFEEDYTPHFAEGMEVKSKLRETLYESLYGEDYAWGNRAQTGRFDESFAGKPAGNAPSSGLAATAVNPETGTMELPEGTKYAPRGSNLPRVQPATPIDDLGSILDSPLG